MRSLLMPTAALLALATAACSADETAAAPAPASPSPSVSDTPDARTQLAGIAAKALDKSFAALYTIDDGNGHTRNLVAQVGADGTWRVDVAGGALGGTVDISIVSTAAGVYQCTVTSPTCVKVAEAGKKIPAQYDPRVEKLFRQWLKVFTDRQSALSVATAAPLDGVQAGSTCFSIDSINASLQAPVDVGIYCYAADGLLTGARVAYGVVKLAGTPQPGAASIGLPGPETQGQPLDSDAPTSTTSP